MKKRKEVEKTSEDDDSTEDEVEEMTVKRDDINQKKKQQKKEASLLTLPLFNRSSVQHNQLVSDLLSKVAEFEKSRGAIHKYNAYRKAIQSISAHPNKIKSGQEAKKLDGVGLKISQKVQEILDTGKLKKLEKLQSNETMVAIKDLEKVSGIGPVMAKKLVDEGIKTLDDLRKISHTLNHHQQIGLKYFEDFEQRIPRKEIEEIESIAMKCIKSIDKQIIAETCGSYRRGAATTGDIDILLSHPLYSLKEKEKKNTFKIIEKIVQCLKNEKIIVDDISLGPMKYMGCCVCPSPSSETKIIDHPSSSSEEIDTSETEPEDEEAERLLQLRRKQRMQERKQQQKKRIVRRIDFKLIPIESYYFGLLHNTGSDEFNRQMRVIALSKGYTLSEYSIKKMVNGKPVGDDILVNSEKEIFDIIGLKYYPPTERSTTIHL